MTVRDFTLYDMLARNAHGAGDSIAIITETQEQRTYREVLERVDALAGGLADAGLTAGDRICVLAQNSAAFLELYFVAARLGAVIYPFNWRLTGEEIERLLGRAQPSALAVGADFVKTLPAATAEIGIKLQMDGEPSEGYSAFDSLYGASPPEPGVPVSGSSPIAIIATAAVEVIPRGAVLTHDNLLAANLQSLVALGLDESSVHLAALPLFHIAGLGNCLATTHAGGTNVIMAKYDAGEARRLVDEHRVTLMFDFPPVLSSLLDAADAAGSRLESLRIVSGLDSPETIQRLHESTRASFWSGFGQTETSGFVTVQRVADKPGAAGRPAHLTRIRLVDDYDQEVPAGTPGEILVRGPVVHAGYDAEPEVTEHTLRGGWHHTGDIGRFDEDGYLYYVKRMAEKELIKPGGENVYPAEVETVIMELEPVSGVCVFGVPDREWGEAIMAVVEVGDDELDAQRVIDHVASRIARFKKPKHVQFTDALPRGDDAGVDREAVKSEWGEGADLG